MKFSIYRKSHFFLPVLIFLLVSGVLIFSWFRFGFIYGGGDVGLPSYNPQRVLEITRYIWWEAAAPGSPVPQGLTSAPLQLALSGLQTLGLSPLTLQAALFFCLLFFMGLGMYLLAASIFGYEQKIYAYLAALFYMFNPYMMIQVWHRFIHNAFFLAAALPFFLIFFRSWIKGGKYSSLLLFLLTNLLSLYLFGTIAFIVTVWIFLFLVTVFEIFIPWQSKQWALKLSQRFIVGGVFWVLLGSWWLIPIFSVGASLFSEQQTSEGSLITLLEISRQAALPYSLQMVNPFYLFETTELGDIYKNPIIRLIPWIFVIVIALGFIKSLRDRKVAFFGLFFIVAVFLSKGSATPFGYPFLFSFINLFFVGVLRNPFEKLGIFLPFAGSILFAVGVMVVYKFFSRVLNKQLAKIIILSLMVLVFGFSWPMISGTVFGRIGSPPFIKVPDSYLEADKWLNSQRKDGRILHLPLPLGESVSYNWEYGYNGVDPSSLFFTSNPSISRGFNVEIIDKALKQLSLAFHPQDSLDSAKIIDLLQVFNVKFIVIHKDIKWSEQKLDDPNEVEKVLNSLSFLEKKAVFGDLVIYEFSEKYYQPKIIIADNISLVSPAKNAPLIWQWLTNSNKSGIASASATISLMSKDSIDEILSSYTKKIIIFPTSTFSFPETSKAALIDALNKLALSPNSPSNSPLVELLYSKNYLDTIGGNLSGKSVAEEIITASQDLIQMYQLAPVQTTLFLPIIQDYTKSINEVFVNKADELSLYSVLKDPSEIFKSHLLLLLNIEPILDNQQRKEIKKSIDQIRAFLEKKNSLVAYPLLGGSEENIQRQILTFWIPSRGKYELYMINPQGQKELNFQINDQVVSLKGKEINNLLFFGEVDFKEGLSEVSLVNATLYEIFLKRVTSRDDTQNSGQIIKMEEKSPGFYQGVVSLKRGAFIFFKETYHSGWKLELIKGDEVQKIAKHYLAGIYGNGWYIENPGEYEFKLEFAPQQKVTTGIYLSMAGYFVVLLLTFIQTLKRKK